MAGGLLQLGAIWLMRAKGWPFWCLIPIILAHQYLFTAAYQKAPSFVIQWFLTAAITGVASYGLGVLVLSEKISGLSATGIAVVMLGLALMKLGQ